MTLIIDYIFKAGGILPDKLQNKTRQISDVVFAEFGRRTTVGFDELLKEIIVVPIAHPFGYLRYPQVRGSQQFFGPAYPVRGQIILEGFTVFFPEHLTQI